MKTKISSNHWLIVPLLIVVTLFSCKEKEVRKTHEIEVSFPGSSFYLNQVKNKQAMQISSAAEDSLYASYYVGFMDSTFVSRSDQKKQEEDRNTYYRFRMGDHWRALVDGDSLTPVFYQPAPQADNRIQAGVIVFQIENGKRPDTLVYRSAADGWPTMKISLKQKQLIQ